jgi:hypothetical protein
VILETSPLLAIAAIESADMRDTFVKDCAIQSEPITVELPFKGRDFGHTDLL